MIYQLLIHQLICCKNFCFVTRSGYFFQSRKTNTEYLLILLLFVRYVVIFLKYLAIFT